MSSSAVAIRAEGLSKVYRLYDRPVDRLKQMLARGRRRYGREFHALQDVSFDLRRGEVLGLVGRNGAGKSTLLQMICGTLTPSAGRVTVAGRVAALLELGAGFNPDFTGRENVFLNAAILGLSREEIDARYEDIVAFSGIGEFIHQPVKVYSSGMYVRLAFSIAISVDPDILIIDEALSVGDGEFARKSFDRIMQLKERGATILFCSHSLFQIESLCSTAIWLHGGRIAASGDPKRIVTAYQAFLDEEESVAAGRDQNAVVVPQGHARLTRIRVADRDVPSSARPVLLHSLRDTLHIEAEFASDPKLPVPSFAVTLHTPDQRIVASAGAWNDGIELQRDTVGRGRVGVRFPGLALLKGRYTASVYLFCERGLHQYDVANHVATIEVRQDGIEQGVVHLPHEWQVSDVPHAHPRPQVGSGSGSVLGDPLSQLADIVARLPIGETLPRDVADRLEEAPGGRALLGRFGFVHDEAADRWLLERRPRWRLAWATRGERVQWMRLFRKAFGDDMPDALWDWKYPGDGPVGTAVYRDDEMVAFYGGMSRRIRYLGTEAMAVQIGDVMVSPSERGVMTRSGPFQMAAATFLEQRIGFGRPFLLGFGFPTSKAMRLAERLSLYAQVDSLVELRWPAAGRTRSWHTSARSVTARELAVVDTLWSEMADALHDAIIGVRDAAAITRRYLEHPAHRYHVLLVRQRLVRTPLGVVILRDRVEEGVEVVDFVAPPERFPALLDVARRFAHRLGRESTFAWITASHASALEVADAQRMPLGLAIPANVWSPGPGAEELRDRWWLMAGDTDFR